MKVYDAVVVWGKQKLNPMHVSHTSLAPAHTRKTSNTKNGSPGVRIATRNTYKCHESSKLQKGHALAREHHGLYEADIDERAFGMKTKLQTPNHII